MGESFDGGLIVALCALVIVGWASYLCWWDVRHRRLPDYLTLSGAAVMLAAGLVYDPLAVAVGALWPGLIVLVAILAPGKKGAVGIGGGDLKLSISLGIAAAMCGGVMGVLAAIVVSNLITMVIAVVRHTSTVPHGPSMLAAVAVVGVAAMAAGDCGDGGVDVLGVGRSAGAEVAAQRPLTALDGQELLQAGPRKILTWGFAAAKGCL